jgi:hypothetical protein
MTNQMIQNSDFVTRLFVIVDDLLKIFNRYVLLGKKGAGRNSTFSDSEIIVLILLRWKTSCTSWKSFYHEVFPYYYPYFRKQIKYQNFIASVHRIIPVCLHIISFLNFLTISKSNELFYLDSCPIPVCHIKRASRNRVCKNVASRKKSTMGWFFGFKLHAVCNHLRQLVAIAITTGSLDDRDPVKELVKNLRGTIYADAGYIGEELRKSLAENGITLMAAPRKNMKKWMSAIQHMMLKKRQKIEQVFSVVKKRLGLDCSLARSVNGVFVMLLSAVMWYQVKTVLFGNVIS